MFFRAGNEMEGETGDSAGETGDSFYILFDGEVRLSCQRDETGQWG